MHAVGRRRALDRRTYLAVIFGISYHCFLRRKSPTPYDQALALPSVETRRTRFLHRAQPPDNRRITWRTTRQEYAYWFGEVGDVHSAGLLQYFRTTQNPT